jgi:hypothetical protein
MVQDGPTGPWTGPVGRHDRTYPNWTVDRSIYAVSIWTKILGSHSKLYGPQPLGDRAWVAEKGTVHVLVNPKQSLLFHSEQWHFLAQNQTWDTRICIHILILTGRD